MKYYSTPLLIIAGFLAVTIPAVMFVPGGAFRPDPAPGEVEAAADKGAAAGELRENIAKGGKSDADMINGINRTIMQGKFLRALKCRRCCPCCPCDPCECRGWKGCCRPPRVTEEVTPEKGCCGE